MERDKKIGQIIINGNGGEAVMRLREFVREEDGMGVVEIILIIVVLIGLVIIFKKQIVILVNSILTKMTSQANQI